MLVSCVRKNKSSRRQYLVPQSPFQCGSRRVFASILTHRSASCAADRLWVEPTFTVAGSLGQRFCRPHRAACCTFTPSARSQLKSLCHCRSRLPTAAPPTVFLQAHDVLALSRPKYTPLLPVHLSSFPLTRSDVSVFWYIVSWTRTVKLARHSATRNHAPYFYALMGRIYSRLPVSDLDILRFTLVSGSIQVEH